MEMEVLFMVDHMCSADYSELSCLSKQSYEEMPSDV